MGHRYESKPPLFIYLPIYDYMNQTRYKCPVGEERLLFCSQPPHLRPSSAAYGLSGFYSIENIKHQVIHLKAKIKACILDNESLQSRNGYGRNPI